MFALRKKERMFNLGLLINQMNKFKISLVKTDQMCFNWHDKESS